MFGGTRVVVHLVLTEEHIHYNQRQSTLFFSAIILVELANISIGTLLV
mgnify:CR=1 FL=1